jgi:hypothetical protein
VPDTQRPRTTVFVGLLVGGVFLGAAGAVMSSARIQIGDHTLPWGLVLAVLALGACARGAAYLTGSRRGAATVVLGWVAAVLVIATVNPGGDVLLPDLPRTYVFLASGVVVSLLAATWPLPTGADALAAQHPGAGGSHGSQVTSAELSPDSAALPVDEADRGAARDIDRDGWGPDPSGAEQPRR